MTEEQQGAQVPNESSLLAGLLWICQHHERPLSAASATQGLPIEADRLTPNLLARAAARADFSVAWKSRRITELNPALLPALMTSKQGQTWVITSVDSASQSISVVNPDTHEPHTLHWQDAETQLGLIPGKLPNVAYVRPEFQVAETSKQLKQDTNKHWFWSVIKENRRIYRDVLLASILINLFAVAMPLYVMNVYDRVVPNFATETLWVLSVGLLVVLVADFTLKIMRSWFVDLAATRADIKISANIMERVLNRQLKNRPASSGSFAASIQSFEHLRGFIGSMTLIALVDFPFIFLFTFIIFIIAPIMAAPIVVGAIIVLLYALIAQVKLQQLAENSQQASAMRNGQLIEGVSNIEHLKSFRREGKLQRYWEQATQFLAETQSSNRFVASSINYMAQTTQHLVAVSIVIIGVYLIIDGQLSQGGLIAAYLLSSRAMAPVAQAAGLLGQYHQAKTALDAVNTIMEEDVERPKGKSWVSRPKLKGAVEFKNVEFNYPNNEQSSLKGISFKLNPGDKLVILGRNGSGKSTLKKLLLGLYQPTNGQIFVDGVDIHQIDPAQLREYIGYVPQDIRLFMGSIKDNIVTGNPLADEQLVQLAELTQLQPLLNQADAGWDSEVGEGGQRLSGGQKQLIGLARGLAYEPNLVLLDEPTSSLDHATEEVIKKNLSTYLTDRTAIISTHRTSLLALATRVMVIDHGKIVADGPKDTVLDALKKGKVSGAS
ncbi:ABC transporter [Thiomicrospira aerophila AL3]|uniref:ABC transporter n=1 Tax=Thiomicrospira aerophila AL3 TaxID=717772 RepID=W0DP34_9GAMM|nr:type I secretion system permease/ATPase [Thiomicrospira aerophila]AHF00365.1 ABC transporter [Thiomicrospira aerophila AL3]